MEQTQLMNPNGGNLDYAKESRNALIRGLLIGGAVGGITIGTGTYFITRHYERKKAREELKRCKSYFYSLGHDEATIEYQEFINNEAPKQMRKMVIDALRQGASVIKDESVRNAILDKAIESLVEDPETTEKTPENAPEDPSKIASESSSTEEKGEKPHDETEKPASDDSVEPKSTENPDKMAGVKEKLKEMEEAAKQRAKEISDFLHGDADEIFEKPAASPVSNPEPEKLASYTEVGENLQFLLKNGETIKVPQRLFFDENGVSYGSDVVRENIRGFFGRDFRSINRLWRALGYGDFMPGEFEIGNMSPEELMIDDVSDEEAYQKTIERERYLDEVDRYIAKPEEGPWIISRKEFNEECYLDKEYVDYFAGDNTFVSNANMDVAIDNTFELFGVVDGNELFKNRPAFDDDEDDNDPDVVHIKNFKFNTVMEVTRTNRSYAELKDGRIYFDGDSGTV